MPKRKPEIIAEFEKCPSCGSTRRFAAARALPHIKAIEQANLRARSIIGGKF